MQSLRSYGMIIRGNFRLDPTTNFTSRVRLYWRFSDYPLPSRFILDKLVGSENTIVVRYRRYIIASTNVESPPTYRLTDVRRSCLHARSSSVLREPQLLLRMVLGSWQPHELLPREPLSAPTRPAASPKGNQSLRAITDQGSKN